MIKKNPNKPKLLLFFCEQKYRNRIFFILAGLASTIWFLIRVIPKPSRAGYPCMRAAAPFMSAFMIYLGSIGGSALFFRKARQHFKENRYLPFMLLLICGSIFTGIFLLRSPTIVLANAEYILTPNTWTGKANGIKPGRVTWYWDNTATNENCKNSSSATSYYLPNNTDKEVVGKMVDESLKSLTGESTLSAAWDSMFHYFNRKNGKGNIGYLTGEKIFIKINMVGMSNIKDNFDLGNTNYKAGHTTPQSILAIIRNLVEKGGVPQKNISVGDPNRPFPNVYYDVLHPEYPKVNYLTTKTGEGRTLSVKGTEPVIFYSDRGKYLREGDPDSWGNCQIGDTVKEDCLFTVITDADYLINMANMKAHERAGISLCAKNHFGSHTRANAKQLHMGLVHPNQKIDDYSRDTLGMYRVLVDLMSHKDLGLKTLLFIIDGLYSAPGAGKKIVKSQSAPFNNDWMSSIFMSMDNVAIESVALDFLREEYTEKNGHEYTCPQYYAIEDYLLQAADSAYWPEGIYYDPENDGTIIPSIGVYEHWNNPKEKAYSRNMGTGEGIELIKVHENTNTTRFEALRLKETGNPWPNPFTENIHIPLKVNTSNTLNVSIYSVYGKRILNQPLTLHAGDNEFIWNGKDAVGNEAKPGVYIVRIDGFKEVRLLKN